jgi:predicted O-methyltransferase YrrM
VAGSPENQRLALMHTVNVWRAWTTLTDCVRTGTAVQTPGVEGRDQEWTKSFIAAMHRGAQSAAPQLVSVVGVEGVRRLLDIGGGSGAYSIAFAQAKPDLHAEVLDLPSVVPIAQRHIQEAGLSSRVTTRVGDLFKDDFGSDYDLILLSAICHMLGPKENLDLLQRCAGALRKGGRVVIRDFILEPDKTAPRGAALFALNMLVATRSGSTYTEKQYADWLESSGFDRATRPDPDGDLILASKR